VVVQVISLVLQGAVDLTSTEVSLGVGFYIQNDSKSGSHVNSISLFVKEQVLSRVGTSVPVNVLKLVLAVWLLSLLLWVVVGWLSDGSSEWLSSQVAFQIFVLQVVKPIGISFVWLWNVLILTHILTLILTHMWHIRLIGLLVSLNPNLGGFGFHLSVFFVFFFEFFIFGDDS
jgi:hypothetical protein